MQPGNDKIVSKSYLAGVLSQKRDPKPTELDAPSANISGRWDADIEFFQQLSKHAGLLSRMATGYKACTKENLP